MGKRTTFDDDDDTNGREKRVKLSIDDVSAKPANEDIRSSEHLRHLLAFQQDGGPQMRKRIQSFKAFLESIMYGDDAGERRKKLEILSGFLVCQRSASDDRMSNPLPDVILTWRFAAQANNDGLLSAIPAVLALLLKTISTSLDMRESGVDLCKTLLQTDQVKLLDRGLGANRTKEHLISPCLRLLTEIVSFDAGSSARNVYLQRDTTFKRLETFLNMRSLTRLSVKAGQRKPSVRSNALRFLFANFRYQDRAAKTDILSQMKLSQAIFQGIKDDPLDTILDVFDSVKETVLLDDSLSRTAKSRLLTDQSLVRIAALQDYVEDNATKKELQSVHGSAYSFLIFVCTTLDHGALIAQTGWFPTVSNAKKTDTEDTNALDYQIRYKEKVPVRNTKLATLLQSLRPFASTFDRKLALAIFAAAPELVADYFFKKKSFSFDPKLSATWIGYSAFLFSVTQLPISEALSHTRAETLPPPVTIVIESILPQPMTQRALTRCLNQKSDLIAFFAVRLMVMAFSKLDAILQDFRSSNRGTKWKKAASALIKLFCQRCPELKHVIAAFRSCHIEKTVLRESLTHLLALYYHVTPHLALDEKFVVSIALMDQLATRTPALDASTMNMQHLDLDHLLEIAYRSPDMDWFQKSATMPFSPFTTILRELVYQEDTSNVYWKILQSVSREHCIVQQDTDVTALDALVSSLKPIVDREASNVLYEFLDSCINRFVRKPMKYSGDLEELEKYSSSGSAEEKTKPASLLPLVMVDQWPFFTKSNNDDNVKTLLCWIAKFLQLLHTIGEDPAILLTIQDRFDSANRGTKFGSFLAELLINTSGVDMQHGILSSKIRLAARADYDGQDFSENRVSGGVMPYPDSKLSAFRPPAETDDHPGLNRWMRKDIPEAIQDNSVGDLLFCLCSKYDEIRRQALSQARALQKRIETSSHSEWQQYYVLLGEVLETASARVLTTPFPYFAGVIAAQCVLVLDDPLHFMYTKINKFLNKSPGWTVQKLPAYWIDQTFMHPPTDDDSHQREIEWVLEALMDGLRTEEDMEIYRNCKVFERLLSWSMSPDNAQTCVNKMIHLLYRASFVQGSTTLITRCGALSWIDARLADSDIQKDLLRTLATYLYDNCAQQRVSEWGNGTVASTVDRVQT